MHHFKEWGVGKKVVLGLLGLVIFAGITLLFGLFVMLLWNWLMPEIFSLPIISYWQAWGLVVLAHLLFKGGHGHHKPWQHHVHSKWRSKLRQHFHDHLGGRGHRCENGEENNSAVDEDEENI